MPPAVDTDAVAGDARRRLVPWSRFLRWLGMRLLALPLVLAVALPLAWMGFIWVLSSQRIDAPGDAFGLWGFFGNLAHAPLFGLLALFWVALFLRQRRGVELPLLDRRTGWIVFLIVGAYGVVDEWHQRATGGRQSSALDVLTDVVGAACVLWIVRYLGGEHSEGGLRRRLLVGLAACAFVAWIGLR